MIYWNTTPGAEYDIAVPNPRGILPEDVAGMALHFEVLGDVSLKQFPSGDFPIDAVTPGWFITHQINAETVAPGDFPPDGEYTYRAYLVPQGGGERILVSEGLVIFGDYHADREQYDKPIQYEQYD